MNWNHAISHHFQGAPKLALFDLDGTLVDSIPSLTLATVHMLEQLGLPPAGEAQVRLWVGNGVDMLIRRALTQGDDSQGLALAVEEFTQAKAAFRQAYLAALTQAVVTFPGVDEFLVALSLPKVLITNKSRIFTERLLPAIGLEQHFVQIICGDDLAEKKPSPLPLLYASQSQGVAPEHCLMFGDSRNDIQAARAAGMASVAVTYGYNHGEDIHQAGANWVVDNLLETLCNT